MNWNDPLWYKDAIIYQLHVKAFCDANGDGIGDFDGLASKLDYLSHLGVTAVWLLPFYPSPLRDDGYDIGDYRDVHPLYGQLKDFKRFVREAHKRNLKVITELVINHTSDQHPWFQRARKAKPGSKWRDFYVWSDTNKRYEGTRIIFCDTETSNWQWDDEAGQYYWHRFFHHQPDLNFDNPRVFEEVTKVMKLWLDMGVDGMRLDAIPYLCERDGTNNENLPETHQVLKNLRTWLDENYPEAFFLAEANQWPEDVRHYFGDDDECHMAFHFPLMPRIYMAVAQEDRHPVTDIMRQTPEIPEDCQWAIFLRNHDELTLEMVTDKERDYLWSFYAADTQARINLGIRRRLAPLLGNDRRKIELLNSLLMSMPGTPIVYYGDEIGMGDNIYLGDRDGVRTPMQWSSDRNGGFSRANPQQLYLPAIMDPVYGFEAVNVEAQSQSPSSMLNWMRTLIAVRKRHVSFGRGSLRFLFPGNRKVLAYLREYDGEIILCVANLSPAPQPVELDLSEFKNRVPVELMGQNPFPPVTDAPYFVTLTGYGFYWFLLASPEDTEAPDWHEAYVTSMPELLTLVMPNGWDSVLDAAVKDTLCGHIMPEFLPKQRWFGAKDTPIANVTLGDHARIKGKDGEWFLGVCDVDLKGGARQHYQLPLDIAWETMDDDPTSSLLPFVIGRVRTVNRLGVVYDALANEPFTAEVLRLIREGGEVATHQGRRIVFKAGPAFGDVELPDDAAIKRMGGEQSNSSMLISDQMVIKFLRRLDSGIHPELEIGRYLTDVAGFKNVPPLLGSVELMDQDGTPTALALLQGFVMNQGDGWDYTLKHLRRFLEKVERKPDPGVPDGREEHSHYIEMAGVLGRRLAEMHKAMALETDDPAFQPELVGPDDVGAWTRQVFDQADQARKALEGVRGGVDEDVQAKVDRMLDRWDAVNRLIQAPLPRRLELYKTRFHGDFHLGQVVLAKDDFYLLDFEGEPVRSLDERRAKHLPIKDVAGMVRSFNYAAWASLFERAAIHPEVMTRLQPWTEEWEILTVGAFLEGYRGAIDDCPSVPSDLKAFHRLMDLFVLEKALYEICYEAANRPDWLRIPLQGVSRLISRRR